VPAKLQANQATTPTAGRPYGAKAALLASHKALRHTHFSYVRFAIEGIALRDAWLRCLAYSGGVDDQRHFEHRLQEICAQIWSGAAAHDLIHLADTALGPLLARPRQRTAPATLAQRPLGPASVGPDIGPGKGPEDAGGQASAPDTSTAAAVATDLAAAALPSLDEWVAQRCAELGIDPDFQRQSDWLAEYQEEFDLDLESRPASVADAVGQVSTPANPPARSAIADRDEPAAKSRTAAGGHGSPDSTREGSQDHSLVHAPGLPSLTAQLTALNTLAGLLVVPPGLDDTLEAWLAPALCLRLRAVGVATLGHLADFIDVHRFRWHTRVPGLGAVRAQRLVAWLAPLATELGRPLLDLALQPAWQLALARERQLATLDPASLRRYGLVPLDRLDVPPELSGRQGTFRVAGPNTFGAEDDLAALQAWLQRHAMSPRTFRSYGHAVEVFYLWCVWERRKALSSLVEADLHAFRAFVAAPPADWVQPRRVDRGSDEWRPLRGPLSPQSQRHLFAAVGALYSGLVEAGYLSVQLVGGVKPHLALPRSKIDVRRAFSDAQWAWVMATLADLPDTPHTRRLRLVLVLGVTTGLRLAEMCTARLGDLQDELVDGRRVWLLHVVGKGRRERDVVIHEDVKALIDRHQADMARAGIGSDPRAPVRTLLPPATDTLLATPGAASPGAQLAAPNLAGTSAAAPLMDSAGFGWTGHLGQLGQQPTSNALSAGPLQPLIGALRRPVKRWKLDADGQPALDHATPLGDRYGALDPSALLQALKRLLRRAADRAHLAVPPLDGAALSRASTHWLRHTFANNAVDDQVEPIVLRDALGHADLGTTSIYLKPEQKALVAQMAKMRRRG
jgi:site-specific recombinase XerD